MSRPAFPTPGTTFGPDAASLDALREVLRAWPRRGVWHVRTAMCGSVLLYHAEPRHVDEGETWTYVGPHPSDKRDTAEPEPARTATAHGWVVTSDDGEARVFGSDDRQGRDAYVEACVGHVVTLVVPFVVRAPLPVEPAVVVGTVVGGDS